MKNVIENIAGAGLVEWKFPRTGNCHEGIPFADGRTGVLVWGGGDTVNLTLGRSDMWDHRGGYPWLASQNYANIISLVRSGKKAELKALFKKDTPSGEPRNPYMLPLGRVVVKIPGAELKNGALDPFTGIGTLSFEKDGALRTVELAMCKSNGGIFAMKFPCGVMYDVDVVPAMTQPRAREALLPLGFKDARIWKNCPDATSTTVQLPSDGGFVWELPADKPVQVRWISYDGELFVQTERSAENHPVVIDGEKPFYESVNRESRDHWAAFWKKGARVNVPDPVLQRMFNYGMYRYGAMTDPDGVPAGLQGPWLEDDRLVPWNGDYHFNINVQECYAPSYRGGHFEHLMPLFKMVLSWRPSLRENARQFVGIDNGYVLPHSVDDRGVCIGGFWTGTVDHGSTAWVAAMMMKYVRYSGDVEFLKAGAFDFMQGAMNVYRAMMEEHDGCLSIPLGPSPEWCGDDVQNAVGRDPSFQLAAAHRLARDLVDAAKLLGEKDDPMWTDVDRRLPLYSSDESGICLFDGQPLTDSHRHHSHLAGYFPFDVNPVRDPELRPFIDRTFCTWSGRGSGQWTGWCVPWAAILNAHVGYPQAAVHYLHVWDTFFCDEGHGSHHNAVFPGFTAYSWGRDVMQMDGQCAAATAVLELLAHDVEGKTEFFMGCPPEWEDVSFENLALSDGRRVSGRRVNGKITISPCV